MANENTGDWPGESGSGAGGEGGPGGGGDAGAPGPWSGPGGQEPGPPEEPPAPEPGPWSGPGGDPGPLPDPQPFTPGPGSPPPLTPAPPVFDDPNNPPPPAIGPFVPGVDDGPPPPPLPEAPEGHDPSELKGGRDIELPPPAESELPPFAQAGDSGGEGCFVVGTPVLTASGQTVAIEDVGVGSALRSLDVGSGMSVVGTVEEVFRAESEELVVLSLDGEVIRCTPRHRFFTGTWVAAGELKPGDAVHSQNGERRVIREVVVEQRREPVLNLHVMPAHTYLVGWTALLVHNDKETTSGQIPGDSSRDSQLG